MLLIVWCQFYQLRPQTGVDTAINGRLSGDTGSRGGMCSFLCFLSKERENVAHWDKWQTPKRGDNGADQTATANFEAAARSQEDLLLDSCFHIQIFHIDTLQHTGAATLLSVWQRSWRTLSASRLRFTPHRTLPSRIFFRKSIKPFSCPSTLA